MVDRIRVFNSDFNGVINIDELFVMPKPKGAESGYKYYKLKSPRNKKENIFLTVKIGIRKGKQFVSVEGSIRKWFFSMNGFQDLDYYRFEKAIERISEILFFDKEMLWGFKVSVLEIGFNVQLRMIMKGIVDGYCSYSTFRRIWYEGETMCFEGDSYSMIVYDKGEEVVKKRSAKKSKVSPVPIEKLIERATWLRFEFKTETLSKVPKMSKLANTLGKILENWDEILDVVHDKVKDMKYVHYTLPTYTDELVGGNKTQLKNYLINITMLTIGVGKTMSLVDKLKRDKENVKKELQEMNRTFVDKPRLDIERDLKWAISKRVRKLKANDRVF